MKASWEFSSPLYLLLSPKSEQYPSVGHVKEIVTNIHRCVNKVSIRRYVEDIMRVRTSFENNIPAKGEAAFKGKLCSF